MLLALPGCDSEYADGGGLTVPTYIRMAPEAPPDPKPEDVPFIDHPQTHIWRPGYWAFLNGSWDWVAGGIVARPDPTAVWSPDHWVQLSYGWCFQPGYWQ